MDVRNCRNCRRLYNYISGPNVCPACREELEKKFQVAKDFIRNTKGANVAMVAEAADVTESQVKEWVREERLEFTKGVSTGIICESCGSPIATGRFCEKCKATMINDLGSVVPKTEGAPRRIIQEKENPRMRFLDSKI